MIKKILSICITFVPCYVFWLLLTLSLEPRELICGAVICLLAAWFSCGFFVKDVKKALRLFNPWRWLQLLYYLVVVFFWEMIKANWAMAVCVLTGKKFRQAIVKIPVRGLKNDHALAFLADCITLTPGTITVDVAEGDDKADHYMYIQWLDLACEDPEQAAETIKGPMEKWIRRICE